MVPLRGGGRRLDDGAVRRRPASVLVSLLAGVALLVPTVASAGDGGDDARRRGSCSGGPGEYRLRVRRGDDRTLRIRFRIDDVDPGETWQLFLSRDGVRVATWTRRASDGGDVRVRRRIRDRAGRDRIAAAGVNAHDGTSCGGAVRI
jgi:hypothetical protein